MKENKSAFFQQKYPEILPFANGAGTDFDRYDWAFNSEDTDPEILSQCKATLDNPDSSDDEKQTASFVVSRDGLKKNLRTEYKIGQISKAVDEGNENAELLGWLDLLGCTEPDESIEDSCRIHCGGKTPKEALQYFRDNFKGHIENGDTEAEKFSALSPEQKRKFIGGLHESELSEDTAKVDNMGLPIAGRSRGKTREMTNEQFDKWSKEYLDGTKYNKFRNMIFHSGERNVRLGLALSMTQDADSQKAFIPALQSLSQEDRDEIYYVAHEFNPEVDMWNLVKDDFIQSWADIPQALKNGYDWIKTTPADLKQYVDSHGGLDKIMSDEKTKDEFRNKYFTATGAFLGFNRFALPAGGGDTALRDYASRVYDMGKGALELRARYDEIQNAMAAKYDSKGYVADHIIQGVSFGIQFGQFAVASVVSGGTASLMGALAKGAGAISKADKVLKAGKAVSLAATAQKLATAAKYADKGAYYGRWANKLVIPYFGAMMSVDAQNAAQKAGFTDDQSFVLGAGIGVVNSFLEKIQFGIRSKNIFLGEKVVRAIENHKDILKTVTMQYCIDGIKNRGKHFGEEYFVENLQNVVQEVGLALGGTLSGNDYKDAMSIVNDLFIQAKDMIIPLFTATNIGAGTSFGKSLRTFAQAESFGKDVAALHSFNAAIQTNEVLAKMQEAELPALTPQVAQRYFNASTEEERAFVLFRSGMNQKERGKAKKVLSDMEGNLQKRGEALVNAVKNRVESSPEVLLLDDKSAPDHEKNAAYIADFAKAYGIEDEIVYLPTLKDAPAEIIEAARRELANKEYSAADIQELLFGGKGADGFRNGGKIYIVGDKALTPQRTLEILKHESGHRGAEGIRSQKEFKTFLDNLITENGGEEIVREGIRRAKGNVYEKISEERLKAETEKRVKKISESNADTLAKEYGLKVDGLSFAEKLSRLKDSIRKEVIDEDKYTLGEEFMCMLAEKVAGKNELTDAELSTWAKVKDFFVELLSGIPQNEKARDIYIANMIRSIWGREYLEDIPDGDFFDMSDEATDEAGSESMKKEQTIPEELAKKRAATAKKNFLSKIQKRRVFEKKLTAEERETEQRKAEIQEYLDSIPDDDISNKLEAISTVEDEDLLSDEILQYAAENGEKWAEDALEMRLNEREKAEIDKEGDSLLDVMRSGGYKLPTPKAIITDCKQKGLPLSGTLFGEINDLYNSLNFYQQQKYFSPRYVDIDDLANTLAADHNFPYEGSSDFLSDFAENVWGQKETRFSFAGNKDDSRSPAELDALNKKFRELYDKYKDGDVELTPEDRDIWAWNLQGDDGALIESADVPFKIYDIDEAYKFAREHFQGAKFRSKDNHLATLGRNALDKMNSGKARGKTANNRLHALALANVGRIFGNSELLKTEKSRTDTNVKNSLRFYAPLYMDGQLYAVKITAKEFNDGTGESLYSIEGIDVNREPDQSGKPRDSIESSTSSLVSGSVDNFIGKLRKVNKKIDKQAHEAAKQKTYKEAVELVAEEARRKGYNVKVYHGTGANGFNVADASGKYQQYGETNQAHGMGLYMATSRDTALEYQYKAQKEERFDITRNDKPFDLQKELGISEDDVIFAEKAIDQILYKNDRMNADAESVIMSYMSEIEENIENNEDVDESKKLKAAADYFYGYVIDNEINNLDEFYSRPVHGIGKVFDWVHNMKLDELLNEQERFSKQPKIFEKLKKAWNSLPKDTPRLNGLNPERFNGFPARIVFDTWRKILGEDKAAKLLLKNGIRGVIYNGQQDGICYVSFEGGATVKLQDPFTFDDNGQLIPLSERFNDKKADIRFSFANLSEADIGKSFEEIKRKIPYSGATPPTMRNASEKLNIVGEVKKVADFLIQTDKVVAANGMAVNLKSFERPANKPNEKATLSERAYHLISKDDQKGDSHRELDYNKLSWVYNIPETLKNAQAIFVNEWGKKKTLAFVKNYDGTLHIVLVNQKGETFGHLITQFPQLQNKPHAFLRGAYLNWIESKAPEIHSSLRGTPSESVQGNFSTLGNRGKASENANESQGKNTKFSFADNSVHETKRALAKKLAKDMYKRLGDKFDVSNPDARREVKPTDAERMDIYMADMGLLDDDVDDVCNKAEAILWKLLNSSSRKELRGDFDRMAAEAERSFEYSHIVEACIKDAIKNFKDDLNLSKRIKTQEQKDLKAEMDGVEGFDIDELTINNIDLTEAVCDFIETEDGELLPNEPRIDEQIDAIITLCKNWANSEDASYEAAFAKMRATLVGAFNDVSDKFTYGKYIKSAFKAIMQLSECKSEKTLKARSEKLARKFAEFVANEAKDFSKVKVDDAVSESSKRKRKTDAEKRRKDKKAAKKAESRLKKLHRQAVKMFEAFADGQKLPENNKLEIKRKLPARAQAYLAQIKKVVKLDDKKIKERYEYLSKRKSSLEADGEEPNYKERYEMSALMIFGNIKAKTLPEILNAYAELKKLIEGARDGQIKKLEEWEAQIEEKAQPLCASLSLAGNKESAKDGYVYDGAKKNVSMFEHRLRNLFLARKGLSKERGELIERWISDYSQRMSRAAIFERNFANAEMAWLQDELTRLYGSAETGFERLTKVNREWSKFASDAGRDMSLGQIMNILCALEQWQVKKAWENAQKRKERNEKNPDATIDEKFEREYRYWKNLFGSQEAMSELLNDADKALIQSLKARYSQRLEIINPTYERLNGLPMISNGSNYMPIVRLGEFDVDEGGGNVISIFPSYYTPRTISLKALDENVNILQVFSNRAQTDAHFINFADLIFETKELLRNRDFASLLRTNLSYGEKQGFADTIRDVLNGKIKRDTTVDGRLASALASCTAYFGLAFNINSALKQPTSFPAYMLKVPVMDWLGGIGGLISSGKLFSTISEVWNSPFLKDRRNGGEINQILSDFARSEKQLKGELGAKKTLRRMFAKYAFMPIKYADSFAFVLGGTSVYHHFLSQYMEMYPEAEAKRLAMADMMSIGEMTQQSAFIMNMSEGQRQGAGFGRMFSTFRTTNQQYLSFELNAFAECAANPTARNCAHLAKVLLLNHALLPALFNGMGLLLNFAFGDDMDDDDWDDLMKNTAICCALDVFTGWWFGAILKGMAQMFTMGGNRNLSDSMLPASSVTRVMQSALYAVEDVYENGFSDADWFKHFDRIGKSVFSPYRIGRKIYDNITDNNKGVWW